MTLKNCDKGVEMSKYDDDGMSEYQRMLSAQIQEKLDRRGAAGVPVEELPDELYEEAVEAAKKIVGDDPKA